MIFVACVVCVGELLRHTLLVEDESVVVISEDSPDTLTPPQDGTGAGNADAPTTAREEGRRAGSYGGNVA